MSSHTATVSISPDDTQAGLARPTANWVRDFAFVGATSSLLAPVLVTGSALGLPTLLVTCAAGGFSGALLGRILRGPMRELMATVAWPLLVLMCTAIGACWGAVVGAIGALALTVGGGPGGRGALATVFVFFMGYAGVAAAAQLAWFGPAYARVERAGVPTWPLMVGALGTPFLGWAALGAVSMGLWFGGW